MSTGTREAAIPRGKYEVLGKVAVGGFGEIYRVRHRLLEEVRAIKVMREPLVADVSMRERFLREARTAAALRHRHVAQIYDFALGEGEVPYMVQEWIQGADLQSVLLEGGPPPLAETIDIAVQALDALAYLHGEGFVHRDLSPDNIMVTRSANGELFVKLIDLGIAKRVATNVHLTGRDQFIGKLRYAAPEVLASKDRRRLDSRSDLYSFAVLLYELLTGTNPIPGETSSEIVAGHLLKPPIGFDRSDPTGAVPESIRVITLRGLEKDPSRRFQSATELAAALEAARSEAEDAVCSRTTVTLEPRALETTADLLRGAQEELDRAFVETAASSSRIRPWLARVERALKGEGEGRTSTLASALRRHPRRVAVAGIGVLAIATLAVAIPRDLERKVTGRVSSQKTLSSGAPLEHRSRAELPTPGGSELAEEDLARIEPPPTMVASAPSAGRVLLVSDSPELTNAFARQFESTVDLVLLGSLAEARRSLPPNSRGVAVRLSATIRRFSVEIYEISMPTCEVAATGELVELPSGALLSTRTRLQKAPSCGQALERAGVLLAGDLRDRLPGA